MHDAPRPTTKRPTEWKSIAKEALVYFALTCLLPILIVLIILRACEPGFFDRIPIPAISHQPASNQAPHRGANR